MSESAFSAFGAMHPVHDPAGQRVRWFCPWPLEDRQSVLRLLDELKTHEGIEGVTRLTARVLTSGRLDPEILGLAADSGYQREAEIQLSGRSRPVITYLGKCTADRLADKQDAEREQALIRKILDTPRGGPGHVMEQFRQSGLYRLEQVGPGPLNGSDREQLSRMHKRVFPTFPYDFSRKLDLMIKSPGTNLMVVARLASNGKICSFSNLESNDVVMEDGQRFRLAEFDNSMTIGSGSRLSKDISPGSRVRLELARMACRKGVDLCHSESRAGLAAINEISSLIGMRFGGALQKHLLISGKTDIDYRSPSRFETMNVWFLNRQDLADLERACQQPVNDG